MAVHAKRGATSEWFTPQKYTDSAAKVLTCGIRLDPASTAAANKRIGAIQYYDKFADGLSWPWYGTVWLNPPYSDYRGQCNDWLRKLYDELTVRNTTEAVALVQVSVLYQEWAQELLYLPRAALCITNHRIKFLNAKGIEGGSPSHSHAFIYVGYAAEVFREEFEKYGVVMMGGV